MSTSMKPFRLLDSSYNTYLVESKVFHNHHGGAKDLKRR